MLLLGYLEFYNARSILPGCIGDPNRQSFMYRPSIGRGLVEAFPLKRVDIAESNAVYFKLLADATRRTKHPVVLNNALDRCVRTVVEIKVAADIVAEA